MAQVTGWTCATHPTAFGAGTAAMSAHVAGQAGTHAIVNCYHISGQKIGSMMPPAKGAVS